MADNTDKSSLIAHFCQITGAGHDEAMDLLASTNWNVDHAATLFYTSRDKTSSDGAEEPETQAPYTGPRTLDGRPAPQAIPTVGGSAQASSSRPRGAGGIATLGSIKDGTHDGHGHDDDDDDDEDSGDEKPRDLFAGGEKSGLAVQDPKRNANSDPTKSIIKDILKKAKANAEQKPESEPSATSSSHFRGSGMTIGDDDTPSRVIPDPTTGQIAPRPPLRRTLHLWEDGFSVDDGDLRRFDDPQHQRDLEMIRSGRAPLQLMNAEPGQTLDVQLTKHDEKFKKPKTVWKPFSGSGHRLGSPTPGSSSISAERTPAPAQSAPATVATTPEVKIDPEQPTISLRIQLLDGTRLVSRFNPSHTIGDVYDFIDRAPNSGVSSWVLATTFPNKDHTDKSAVLGDMPEFRKGGTAIQKRTDL